MSKDSLHIDATQGVLKCVGLMRSYSVVYYHSFLFPFSAKYSEKGNHLSALASSACVNPLSATTKQHSSRNLCLIAQLTAFAPLCFLSSQPTTSSSSIPHYISYLYSFSTTSESGHLRHVDPHSIQPSTHPLPATSSPYRP